MFKRIRYTQTGTPGTLKSVKTYQHPTNGGRFSVSLDTENKSYSIYDETAKMEVKKGSVDLDTPDSHALKIAAKNALTALGILFTEEGRKPRKAAAEPAQELQG